MLTALALVSLLGWIAVAWTGDLREHTALFLGLWSVLALLYVGAAWAAGRRERRESDEQQALREEIAHRGPGVIPAAVPASRNAGYAGRWILFWAVALRVPMLLAPASLSDDVHRYVRDGWVQVNGINPYAQAPDDPGLEPLRLPDHHAINNPSIPTIYPPGAQALFALAAAVNPAPGTIKVMVTLFDLATILLLLSWLRDSGRPPAGAILYAWHPLVILEGAGSGHVDLVALFFLLLAARAITRTRPLASSLAWGAAVLVKLVPLALIPVWWKRVRVWEALIAVTVLVAGIAPYARGAGWGLLTGFGEYASRWEFNGCVFPIVRWAAQRLDSAALLKPAAAWLVHRTGDAAWIAPLWTWVYPPYVARAICGLAYLVVVLRAAPGGRPIDRDMLTALGALILLSPTVHPWYLVWIVPWLVLHRSAAWMWLTLAVVSSYALLPASDSDSGNSTAVVWGIEGRGMACAALASRALTKR